MDRKVREVPRADLGERYVKPLRSNSDQRQISLCNIRAFSVKRSHGNKGYDHPT